MADKKKSVYNGSLTREQFLFFEMRTAARLLSEGCSDAEAVERIVSENLFQYPTERMIKNLAGVCVKRLRALGDDALVDAIANEPFEISKQICLYAMMRYYRLVWDFMVTVIGEKYRSKDTDFSRADLNEFFLRLQEQDDLVASWSESTVKKIKSVLVSVLVENDYLDSHRATTLNPVWLYPVLENAIRANGDEIALAAFNCFD